MLKNYLKEIYTVAGRGDDREESYYSTLEKLLKEYAASKEKRAIQITTLPKKTEAGNPDFRVWDGKQHIVGYIEAKAPTTKNLDDIEQSAQIKRYLHTFPNCKVVTSLSKTSEIQREIDKLYPRIEQSTIDFGSDKLEE